MGYKDLTGQVFGGITALELDMELSKQKHRGWWKCKCNYCGKEVYYPSDRLQAKPYSCGCVKRPAHNLVDEVGKTYGLLTVVGRNKDPHNNSNAYWDCDCTCGGHTVATTYNLHSGHTTSCGCKAQDFYKYTSKKLIDETGHKYGYLTVIGRNYGHPEDSAAWWDCLCICGNKIACRGTALRAGDNISCGCKLASKGEATIEMLLKEKHISYKTQYTFSDFRFQTTNGIPKFDFAIFSNEKLIFLIEYNGIQHYQDVEYFKEDTITIQAHDTQKIEYCQNHNIPLEIIPYTDFDNLPKIIDELLQKHHIKEAD